MSIAVCILNSSLNEKGAFYILLFPSYLSIYRTYLVKHFVTKYNLTKPDIKLMHATIFSNHESDLNKFKVKL